MRKPGLAWIVAVAMVALVVFVAVEVPLGSPEPASGALPLPVGVLTLPNEGVYYPPCTRATLPTWWAVYLLTVDGSNLTVQVTGAWESTRGTHVFVGDLADDVPLSAMGTWMTLAHCPPALNPGLAPSPPPLPTNGTIDQPVFVWPSAHRVFVQFISFSGADAVFVTRPIGAVVST